MMILNKNPSCKQRKLLPILREKLGRLPITVLTDSLYANEPIIELCEDLGWEYLIVRQEGSLKTVGRKCNESEGSKLYQESYQAHETIKLKNEGQLRERLNGLIGLL